MRAFRRRIRQLLLPLHPLMYFLERKLHNFNVRLSGERPQPGLPSAFRDIHEIRSATLEFVESLRVTEKGRFIGYRFARSTTEPTLYCTLFALLIKHLFRVEHESLHQELEVVLQYQEGDGLFRDPVMASPELEAKDCLGWCHLTMHALMTLALYGVPARFELKYLENFSDPGVFHNYLESLDWEARAAWSSNELQNLGVMLQYARDYQGNEKAIHQLEHLYDVIESHQDPNTGLHGDRFDTPESLSLGIQAAYHFWLLNVYDRRPIRCVSEIVESALRVQNPAGGYGVNWKSSACEDIDSIDILVRMGGQSEEMASRVHASLLRALSEILTNLNPDGSWVFRRGENLRLPHPSMQSQKEESDLFFTWFRTLGLAYCLIGLGNNCPPSLRFDWQLGRAPGLQMAVDWPFPVTAYTRRV